jgi:aspartate aminotransferase
MSRIARKYRIILLSDEIYGEFHYEGRHVSIARFYPEGTIVSTGLSKWCGAGGWRLGTFIFPPTLRWLQDAMAVAASETFSSTCAPIQYAAVQAFQGGPEIDQYLRHTRRILKSLGHSLTWKLREYGVTVSMPQGAFYIFPDFSLFRKNLSNREIPTSDAFCERLLRETGIAILPGSVFGRPFEELTARLAFVDFDGERALAAAEKWPCHKALDIDFLNTYCGNTLNAIDRLGEWLHPVSPARSAPPLLLQKTPGKTPYSHCGFGLSPHFKERAVTIGNIPSS